MADQRIIYDFGANNGDDVDYYLLKSDKVVAVEANPHLAEHVRRRFSQEIDDGRLVVESCALTVEPSAEAVPFYVHKTNHVLSQFPQPAADELAQFDQILVPSINVIDLLQRHGAPFYVKVDIEHYDQKILEALFRAGIYPPYISAESHSIEVLAALIALGGYRSFKLVDGRSVPARYGQAKIQTAQGEAAFSFRTHSAGPFGEDIAGPWMTPNNFFRVLSYAGLGWKDIHASRVDEPQPTYAPQPRVQINIDF